MISTMSGDFDSSKDELGKTTVCAGKSLLAIDVHFQRVSIHPSTDGNGRLSSTIRTNS